MPAILLSYQNPADTATFSGGSFNASFPVGNLGVPRLSKAARTTNAATTSTWFRLTIGATITAKMIALVRHNLSSTATWRRRQSTAPVFLDFTDNAESDALITWQGTGGYTVDSTGALVASAAPRIWYDPATLVCMGLLREPQSTNQLTYSNAIDNAAWTKTGSMAVTANQSNGPTKTATLDRLTQGASADSVRQDVTAAGTSTQCGSFFFRSNTATCTSARLDVIWVTGGATERVQLSLNPTLGASAITGTNAIGATLGKNGIESWGGGLYRVFISGTGTDAANTAVRFQVFMLGTNGEVLDIGETSLEARLTPTSPISTTTTAVTRTMDSGVITAASLPAIGDATEFTLYEESTPGLLTVPTSTAAAVAVADSGVTNYVSLRTVSDSTTPYLDVNVIAASSTTWDTGNTATTSSTLHRQALRAKLNDWAYYIDGTSIATNTSLALPTGLERISLTFNSDQPTFLRRCAWWDAGFTAQQLADITTTGPTAAGWYDSGYVDACEMTFYSAVAESTWGQRHDVQAYDGAGNSLRWARFDINDPDNADGYLQIGRIFIGGVNFQPNCGAEYGLQDTHDDLSQQTRSRTGEVFSEVLPRPKRVLFRLPVVEHTAEAEQLHEMEETEGTTGEIYYLAAHEDDAGRRQRFSFLGLMRGIKPLDYPLFATRSHAFEMEQKL